MQRVLALFLQQVSIRAKSFWIKCLHEFKAASRDWTEVLPIDAENKRARLVAKILANWAYCYITVRESAVPA